jgi:hypothetical protein
MNLERITYHTQEEESILQYCIKRQLDLREETNGMDPLLEKHVQI